MKIERVGITLKSADVINPLRVLFVPVAFAAAAVLLAEFMRARGVSGPEPAQYSPLLSIQMFVAQDPLAAALIVCLIAGAWLLGRRTRFASAIQLSDITSQVAVLVLAGIGIVSAWLIARFIFHGYTATLDEYLPQFQARIFRAGHLLAPLPSDLVTFHRNLQPGMVYVDEARGLWGSHYRPGHAILLALTPSLGGISLLNSFLTGVSIWAAGDIARRLYPDWTLAPVLAALLLLASPQFLVTAGSGFSYPAHLASNLLWLTLFLRGVATKRWRPHVAAALVGAYAIGLHQVHVHPLFALPFLTLLLLGAKGRRVHLLPYVAAYGLALPFWVLWPEIAVLLQSGDASALPRSLSEVDYLKDYLGYRNSVGAADAGIRGVLLEVNLLRFLLWLSPSLALLITVALIHARELTAVHLAAIASVVLTVMANHLLMANQMLSWGARYYHPIIGNLLVLALVGADLLRHRGERRLLETALLLTLASAAILLPLRLLQVEPMIGPRARVQAAIEAVDADVIVVRPLSTWSPFIRNDPFLTDRPLIMLGVDPLKSRDDLPNSLRQGQIRELTPADYAAFNQLSGNSLEPDRSEN